MKQCEICKEMYRPGEDESTEIHICEECAEMQDQQPDFEYMQYSDADNGL